jgi:ankyrin repeat protein
MAYTLLAQEDTNVNLSNNDGNTPLHYLCRRVAAELGDEQLKLVSLLIAKNANVNLANASNETPLHQASFSGCPAVVQLLLEARANPNIFTQ